MAAITYRLGKGSRLTNAEVDDNFRNLNDDLTELYQHSLRSIAGLAPAANKMVLYTGPETATLVNATPFGRSLLGVTDATAAKQLLGDLGDGGFSGGTITKDYGELRWRAASPANLYSWRIRTTLNGQELGDLQVQFSDDNFQSFTNTVEFNPSFTLFHTPPHTITPPLNDDSTRIPNTHFVREVVASESSGLRVHARRTSNHTTSAAPNGELLPVNVAGDYWLGLSSWTGAQVVPEASGLYYVSFTATVSVASGPAEVAICLNGNRRASWKRAVGTEVQTNTISTMIYCNGTTDAISLRGWANDAITLGTETYATIARVAR
jgi:hypothetical protein